MIRVELHDRSNALVRVLSGAKNATLYPVLNQDGAGSFKIHRADKDAIELGILSGGIDGYIVHLLRRGPLETTFSDRFSFVVEAITLQVNEQEEDGAWYVVSGRGTLCLLEDRVAFPPGFDGTNPSTITNQLGQIYAATNGGAIMAAEIDRSNPRFLTQLTHTVNTSTVPQDAKLRFDSLRKLHDYLVGNGPMEAQMVGLDYQAADRIGSDKSATVKIRLGPQDSLLDVALERDTRPVKNWVIAQGTGEGINAKLAVASDTPSALALRRREGFVDARDIDTQAQLSLTAVAAITQFKDPDQRITVKFYDSTHTQLYRDILLGDTVALAVAPLNWSANYRLVGIQITDQDDETEEIHLDFNSMRLEYLLKLAKGAQLTSDSLNVLNRQPQGAQYNDTFTYPDNCDPTHPFRFKFFIPTNVVKLNYAKLSIGLDAFRRPVAAVNNSAVTTGGGTAHHHAVPAHRHKIGTWLASMIGGGAAFTDEYSALDQSSNPLGIGVWASAANKDWYSDTTSGGVTSDDETTHSHSVTSNVGLTDGIFEGATAAGVSVKVNGTDRTSALGGPFNADQAELEIVQWLTVGAWNTVELTPTGLGRIIGHLRLTGYSQSV